MTHAISLPGHRAALAQAASAELAAHTDVVREHCLISACLDLMQQESCDRIGGRL